MKRNHQLILAMSVVVFFIIVLAVQAIYFFHQRNRAISPNKGMHLPPSPLKMEASYPLIVEGLCFAQPPGYFFQINMDNEGNKKLENVSCTIKDSGDL
jgi:hypothetical protein